MSTRYLKIEKSAPYKMEFAINLLESKIGLKYIHEQEFVSHNNLKTTEIYTHVSQRDIGQIKSPLDFGRK